MVWPDDQQNDEQRGRRQRARDAFGRFMPRRGRGVAPAGPRQDVVVRVIEQTGGSAGPAPGVEEGEAPEPLSAECLEQLDDTFRGKYATVLYLRNPNRNVWFGVGNVAVSGNDAVQPAVRSGFPRGQQASLIAAERELTGPDRQPGPAGTLNSQHGAWPPSPSQLNPLLPAVNYTVRVVTEQGQRIQNSCVPQVPVDMSRVTYLPPRMGIPMHVVELYVNTMVGSHPTEYQRWGQRIAQRIPCKQRDVNQADIMAYPDNTCIGEDDPYSFEELTEEDRPWCAVSTCTSDAYIESAKARYPANFRNVPGIGNRWFLPVSIQASQHMGDPDSPLWNPLFVRDADEDQVNRFRQIYLKQRSNPDNDYQVRVENSAEFRFYGVNTRNRTMPPTPEVPGGPPTSGNWRGPRGLTFVSLDEDVIEGEDTFVNNPASPLTLKDWAVVEILRVEGYYDPDPRKPPEEKLRNERAVRSRYPSPEYTYAPAPSSAARQDLADSQWAWVVVRDTSMCVDSYNRDNLNWGLRPQDFTDPANVGRTSNLYSDDSRCLRRQTLAIMQGGGNWEPDPDQQQITRVNTVFRVPALFLVQYADNLNDAIELGRQMFRSVATDGYTMTLTRQRQLLEEIEDGICNPDDLEGVDVCNLSDPNMNICASDVLKIACPCPDRCTDLCRQFITNYWSEGCRCQVQNWLNENAGDYRFEKVQRDYNNLETAMTKCGVVAEPCMSGCDYYTTPEVSSRVDSEVLAACPNISRQDDSGGNMVLQGDSCTPQCIDLMSKWWVGQNCRCSTQAEAQKNPSSIARWADYDKIADLCGVDRPVCPDEKPERPVDCHRLDFVSCKAAQDEGYCIWDPAYRDERGRCYDAPSDNVATCLASISDRCGSVRPQDPNNPVQLTACMKCATTDHGQELTQAGCNKDIISFWCLDQPVTCEGVQCPPGHMVGEPNQIKDIDSHKAGNGCCDRTCSGYESSSCQEGEVLKPNLDTVLESDGCCEPRISCADATCRENELLVRNPDQRFADELGGCCVPSCAEEPCAAGNVRKPNAATIYVEDGCCEQSCAGQTCQPNEQLKANPDTIPASQGCCEARVEHCEHEMCPVGQRLKANPAAVRKSDGCCETVNYTNKRILNNCDDMHHVAVGPNQEATCNSSVMHGSDGIWSNCKWDDNFAMFNDCDRDDRAPGNNLGNVELLPLGILHDAWIRPTEPGRKHVWYQGLSGSWQVVQECGEGCTRRDLESDDCGSNDEHCTNKIDMYGRVCKMNYNPDARISRCGPQPWTDQNDENMADYVGGILSTPT